MVSVHLPSGISPDRSHLLSRRASRAAVPGVAYAIGAMLGVVAATAPGCGGGAAPPVAAPGPKPEAPAAASAPASGSAAPAAKAPAAGGADENYDVDFVPGKTTPPPQKLPRIAFKSPGYELTVPAAGAGGTRVGVELTNFAVGPGQGYVQYVLDGKPFRPVFDLREPVKLADVAGGSGPTEGEHVIVAFPCRPSGEAVKGEGAVTVARFWVAKKTGDTWKPRAPALVLGSPTGTQRVSASDVLVDWYLLNAELGHGKHAVKVLVKGPGIRGEGLARTIMDWNPYVLLNLHTGTYTITVDLVDPSGAVVPGLFNSTTRTFEVGGG